MPVITTQEKVKQLETEKSEKGKGHARTIIFEEELILEEITVDCICGVY